MFKTGMESGTTSKPLFREKKIQHAVSRESYVPAMQKSQARRKVKGKT